MNLRTLLFFEGGADVIKKFQINLFQRSIVFLWAIADVFFVYFCSYQAIVQNKNSRIRTRTVGVEVEHADQMTTSVD